MTPKQVPPLKALSLWRLPVAGMWGMRNSDPIMESSDRFRLLVMWGIRLRPSWLSSSTSAPPDDVIIAPTTSPIPASTWPAWISDKMASTSPSPWWTNDEQAATKKKKKTRNKFLKLLFFRVCTFLRDASLASHKRIKKFFPFRDINYLGIITDISVPHYSSAVSFLLNLCSYILNLLCIYMVEKLPAFFPKLLVACFSALVCCKCCCLYLAMVLCCLFIQPSLKSRHQNYLYALLHTTQTVKGCRIPTG